MPARATIYDFRDIDLMMRLSEEPEIPATELAEAVGLTDDGATQALGRRLGWMKRYGFVAYDPKLHRWSLSQAGQRITESQLRSAQIRALDSIDDEAMVNVMAHVTSRYRHGDAVVAQLLRREFAFGTQKR
jgi:DNA-binding IclR family transcriptional regulator